MASVPTARSTLMASATTSGPIPSPPITASRILRAATAVPYWAVSAAWQDLTARDPARKPTDAAAQENRSGSRSTTLASPAPIAAAISAEQHPRDGGVHREHDQRVAALGVPADLHPGDVDLLAAQDLADGADDAGPVGVAEEHHVLGGRDLHVEPVDLDQFARPAAARRGCR